MRQKENIQLPTTFSPLTRDNSKDLIIDFSVMHLYSDDLKLVLKMNI